MREIKFRAWNECEKIMEYDIQDEYDRECSCFGDFLNNNFYSVMQYTEIKDVNGKEIYEGDIVENEHVRGIVKFGNPDFKEGSKTSMFYVEVTHCDGTAFTFIGDVFTEFNTFKVTGNIYDNSKLLEDK